MAYTTSGQIPVGTSYKLGNYTFNLAVNSTGVFATINDGEKGAAKGASFRNPQIKSWSVEANESEASVYVQFADEPDTFPDHISVIQPPYKLTYEDGESVDITGIKVRAFNSDGTIWDVYPNGIINSSEIAIQSVEEHEDKKFHVATSSLIEEGAPVTFYYATSNDNAYISNYYSASGQYYLKYTREMTFQLDGKSKIAFLRTHETENGYNFDSIYPFLSTISGEEGKYLVHSFGSSSDGPFDDYYTSWFQTRRFFSKKGHHIVFEFDIPNGIRDGILRENVIEKVINNSIPYIYTQQPYNDKWKENLAYAMWYTDEGEQREENTIYHSATVYISWERPVDHEILTASFPIVIKKDNVDSGGEENG